MSVKNTSFNVNPDGSFLFCDGLIAFDADGTLRANGLRSNPDGSIQVGQAFSVDTSGAARQDGGNFVIASGYNLIFTEGGSVVIASPNGSTFKLVVDDSGVLSTIPITV